MPASRNDGTDWTAADADAALTALLRTKRRKPYRVFYLLVCVFISLALGLALMMSRELGNSLRQTSESSEVALDGETQRAPAGAQDVTTRHEPTDLTAQEGRRALLDKQFGSATAVDLQDTRVTTLEHELAMTREQLGAVQKSAADFEMRNRSELAAVRGELAKKGSELDKTVRDLQGAASARTDAETSGRLASEEMTRQAAAFEGERQRGQALAAELDAEHKRSESLAGQLGIEKTARAAADQALLSAQLEIANGSGDVSRLRAQAAQSAGLSEALTSARANGVAADRTIAQLRAEIAEAGTRLNARESDYNASQTALAATEGERRNVAAELQRAKRDMAEQSNLLGQRDGETRKALAALAAANAETQGLRAQIMAASSQTAAAESRLREAEANIEQRSAGAKLLTIPGATPWPDTRERSMPILVWMTATAPRIPEGLALESDPSLSRNLTSATPIQPRSVESDRFMPASPNGIAVSTTPALAKVVARADLLLSQGDVAGARLLLEHAMASGSAEAAFKRAETYDPELHGARSGLGAAVDAELAHALYRRARDAGFVSGR